MMNESPKFAVSNSQGLSVYKVEEISYCESKNNYTKLHFKNGDYLVQAKTLGKIEGSLETKGFLRVHRSFLVNVSNIRHFLSHQKNLIIMDDQSKIPVSRRKKAEVLRRLKNI